jgi:uncharacterized protein involved in exopolysaccharide biosynthesis
MASTKNDKANPFAALQSCGALILVAGLAYWFISPKTYEAVTRLRIVNWVKSSDLDKPTDEKVVFAERDLIRSNVVENPVIQNLHLAEVWSKYSTTGTALSLDGARDRLNTITTVRPVPGSSLIDIRVASEDPQETAQIANALAHSYQDFRQARHEDLIRSKLAELKQQWDIQNEKVQDAQTAVDKLYFQIVHDRSTNQTQFYDADAYDLLIAKRAQLNAKYIDQQSQLVGLKKLDRNQLKEVLTSLDTNSALSLGLVQLNQAESDLRQAQLDHKDDSLEVRQASLKVGKLTEQIGHQVDAEMTVRETGLASLQTMLKEVDRRVKNASTNSVPVNIQDTGYKKALDNLKHLKEDRDNLQKKMDAEESHDALNPAGIRADIIEVAETPMRPSRPDPRLAVGASVGGGFLLVLGFLLPRLVKRAKPPAPR